MTYMETNHVTIYREYALGREFPTRLLSKCPLDRGSEGASYVMGESISADQRFDTKDLARDLQVSLKVSCSIKCRMYHLCRNCQT